MTHNSFIKEAKPLQFP